MTDLERAVTDVGEFLDGRHLPYMVIGGFANLFWGRPRLTQDIGVTVQVPEGEWPDFIARVGERFQLMSRDQLELARKRRVVPVASPAGIRVDLVLAGLPYEESASRRAHTVNVSGMPVQLCAAEDLILHKLASERPRDLDDVEGIILRQTRGLDRAYLDPLVVELARALERPEIERFYRACLAKAAPPPHAA